MLMPTSVALVSTINIFVKSRNLKTGACDIAVFNCKKAVVVASN